MCEENFAVYGVRKVWRQMLWDGTRIARCSPVLSSTSAPVRRGG